MELFEIMKYNKMDVVDARLLYKKLEVGRDFSTWIKERLEKLDFAVEKVDYFITKGTFPQNGGKVKEHEIFAPQNRGAKNHRSERGGHNKIEYLLTINLAKHIAMMENTKIGFKIRQYFIEVEKTANALIPEKVKKLREKMLIRKRIAHKCNFDVYAWLDHHKIKTVLHNPALQLTDEERSLLNDTEKNVWN